MGLQITDERRRTDSGYFRIGHVVLRIPPESITISRNANNQEITTLRSATPYYKKSGHQRLDVVVSWKAMLHRGEHGTDYKQWDDVRTVLAYLRCAPFIEVENAHIRQFVMSAELGYTEIDRMAFAIQSMKIETVPDLDDTLQVTLYLTWFNYKPYTLNFSYIGPDGIEVSAQDSTPFRNFVEQIWMPPNLPRKEEWTKQSEQEFLLTWRRYKSFRVPTDLVQAGAIFSDPALTSSIPTVSGTSVKKSNKALLDELAKMAVVAENNTPGSPIGVPAEFSVAQRLAEYGFRDKTPDNNAFGINASKNYTGKTAVRNATHGSSSQSKSPTLMRAYDSEQDAFIDHARLIANDRNYKAAWQKYVASDHSQAASERLAADVMVKYSEDTKKLSHVLSFMRSKDVQSAVNEQRKKSGKQSPAPPPQQEAAAPVYGPKNPDAAATKPASSSENNAKRDAMIESVIAAFKEADWEYDHRTESDFFFYQEKTINLYDAHTVPVQISVFFQNNLAQLPIESQVYPTMQHVGSPGSLINVSFAATAVNEDNSEPVYQSCVEISDMIAKLDSQFHDMRGRWRAAVRIHKMQCAKIRNKVLNMLGIDYTIPQQFQTETSSESCNQIGATLVLSQYKNRYEAVQGFLVKDPSWKKMQAVSDAVTGKAWDHISSHNKANLKVLEDFRNRARSDRRDSNGNVIGPDITLLTDAVAAGWNPPTTKFNFSLSDPESQAVVAAAQEIATYLDGRNGFTNYTTKGRSGTDPVATELVSRLKSGGWDYSDYVRLMALPTSSGRTVLTQELKNKLARAVDTRIRETMAAGGGPNGHLVEGAPYSNPFFQLRTAVLQYNFEKNPKWTNAVQMLTQDESLRERLWEADEMHTPSDESFNSAHYCYSDLGIKDIKVNPDSYFQNYTDAMREQIVKNASFGAKLIQNSQKDLQEVHFGSGESNLAATAGNAQNVTEQDNGLLSEYEAIITEKINPPRVSMSRAFPTYRLLLIEEDNDGPYYCFDDFYTYNSVLNVEVARYKDKPDVARVQLTNFSNILQHKFYNGTTLSKIEEKDTEFEEHQVRPATDGKTKEQMAAVNPNAERQSSVGYEDRRTGVNHFGNDAYQGHWFYALQPGSKIQIRMGYSNDPDKLWPVFNGVVTEIEDGEIMTLICQGYMVELVNEVLPDEIGYEHESNFKFYQTINGEVDAVLEKMLQGPYAKHFGGRKIIRGKADILSTLKYEPLAKAARDFGTSHGGITAAVLSYLTSRANRASENIYINRYLAVQGEKTAEQQVAQRLAVRPFYVTASTAFPWSTGSFHVPKNVPHLTPWKVMQSASRFWPEYNLLVKNYGFPFQADATVVFGDPSDYFYARARTASEGTGIGAYHPRMDPAFQEWWKRIGRGMATGLLKSLNDNQSRQTFEATYLYKLWRLVTRGTSPVDIMEQHILDQNEDQMVRETLDSVRDVSSFEFLIKGMNRVRLAAMGMTDVENGAIENIHAVAKGWLQAGADWFLNSRDKYQLLLQAAIALDKAFRVFYQQYNDPEQRKWAAGQAMMPVQKWHVITSEHIIHNTISLNDKVYNAVKIDTGGVGKHPEVMKANASIPGEHLRLLDVTDQIIAPEDNLKADNLWRLQAQSFIKEELGKMYRGELVILGQPEIEPGDVVHLADTVRDMFGPIEVESVIHAFDQRDGMISIIRPRALVLINQATGAGMEYAIRQFYFSGGLSGAWKGLGAGLDNPEMTTGAKIGAAAFGSAGAVSSAALTAGALRFGRKAAGAVAARGAGMLAARLGTAGVGMLVPGVNTLMFAYTGYELIHGAISLALDHTAMHPVFLVPLTRFNKPWMSGVARWSMSNMGYTVSQKWVRMWQQEVVSSMEGVQSFVHDRYADWNDRMSQDRPNH